MSYVLYDIGVKNLKMTRDSLLTEIIDKQNDFNTNQEIIRRDLHDLLKTEKTLLNFEKEPYGKVVKDKFGEAECFVKKYLTLDNKQYYLYKAVKDPSKIAYLSRKQYYELFNMMKKLKIKFLFEDESLEVRKNNFLSSKGVMASCVKLLKRAISLGKTPGKYKKLNEETLCMLSSIILTGENVSLRQVNIQEAYDLYIDSNGKGSGERFAVHSCMYNKKVQTFYDMFDAKAYIANVNGKDVARFLVWKLNDGTEYVDRLYCCGGYDNVVLRKIDETFKDAAKYPNPPENKFVCGHPIKGDKEIFNASILPYLDSFEYMVSARDKENKLVYLLVTYGSSIYGEEFKKYLNCIVERFAVHSTKAKLNKTFSFCKKCNHVYGKKNIAHKTFCPESFKDKELYGKIEKFLNVLYLYCRDCETAKA